ncbi:hypothetical protein PVAR5_6811 [Paecilomyces variotii No. 5]|uniref:Uncharacterized protein n=1 Tax=Byssochlamys spectabilis (strain No. 5 / NBRC 109023) TaxID=1356009 RepID=V5G7Y1_BYSSN|nr:hypothetical protein PVAR5_6811 [Paecilomyces variotii No. 5]
MASIAWNEALRHDLRVLDQRISNTESLQFCTDDLQKTGVTVHSASFSGSGKDIGFNPLFFRPTTCNDLPAPDEHDLADEFPEFDAQRIDDYGEKSWKRVRSLEHYLINRAHVCGLDELGWETAKYVGSCLCTILLLTNVTGVSKYDTLWKYRELQWYVQSVYCHKSGYPHIKATVFWDPEGDDGVCFVQNS